ncbi:hypothetical protein [Endozoicomonas sp.]|uniref:hypothetical protein n=1 Tax=Endozoicomonas sp. TaxID=1892382 RepID=UPI00383B917D
MNIEGKKFPVFPHQVTGAKSPPDARAKTPPCSINYSSLHIRIGSIQIKDNACFNLSVDNSRNTSDPGGAVRLIDRNDIKISALKGGEGMLVQTKERKAQMGDDAIKEVTEHRYDDGTNQTFVKEYMRSGYREYGKISIRQSDPDGNSKAEFFEKKKEHGLVTEETFTRDSSSSQ